MSPRAGRTRFIDERLRPRQIVVRNAGAPERHPFGKGLLQRRLHRREGAGRDLRGEPSLL
ncbi:hypothetical protein CQW49_17585 [Methylosinus trichosporium OB3b]|uniref:Uncharacterized protein n=1 Tax=Methylosinus trichosporium (strain ATCC 35070 / NCIMB 11131 / UNIQEM 75 / OB3b) TaxID=595536 RepID=A0A2D2D3P7_METT3|nr:hypothetical protein CQW49_17585 [Methylosinus trichosporium OB3b]OBS51939.1 hypothetical protein A8B73_13585 [Methylosinus sp. 3S-1]